MSDEPTPKEVEELFEHFGDVFGDLFGAPTGSGGCDVRMELALDAEDLARGRRAVTIERFIACEGCHGSGRKSSAADPCPHCEGKGSVEERKGAFQIRQTCSECNGSGSARECGRCQGERGETREEVLQVTIPPGIRDGQILRLRGKGSDPSDGRGAGHLYLSVRIPGAPGRLEDRQAPLHPMAVEESEAPSLVPWVALAIAVVAILVAALLLR